MLPLPAPVPPEVMRIQSSSLLADLSQVFQLAVTITVPDAPPAGTFTLAGVRSSRQPADCTAEKARLPTAMLPVRATGAGFGAAK